MPSQKNIALPSRYTDALQQRKKKKKKSKNLAKLRGQKNLDN